MGRGGMGRVVKALSWMAGTIAVLAIAYVLYCVVAIVVAGPNAAIGGVGAGFGRALRAFE